MRVAINSFHEALNQVSQPSTKELRFGDAGRNIIIGPRNAVEKRPGSRLIKSTAFASGSEVKSLFDFERHLGDILHKYLFNAGAGLHEMHFNSGTEGQIKDGLTGLHGECQYVVAGQVCYIGNGNEMIKYYAQTGYTLGGDATAVLELGANTRMATGFQIPHGNNRNVVSVSIPLTVNAYGVDSSTNLYVQICDDNSGEPGTALVTSSDVPANKIQRSWEWVPFIFPDAIVLDGNTDYWIVLRADAALDASVQISWAVDITHADYSYNQGFGQYVSSWTVNTDHCGLFAVFCEPEKWGIAPPYSAPAISAQSSAGMAEYYADAKDTDETLDQVTYHRLAQSFQITGTEIRNATNVDMYIKKTGTPTGNIYIRIEGTTVTGLPDGEAVGISDKVDVSSLGTAYPASFPTNTVAFEFSNPVSLDPDLTYWIVLLGDSDLTVDASNDIQWGTVAAGNYASGNFATYDGTEWTGVSAEDALFRVNAGLRFTEGGRSYKICMKNSVTGHISNGSTATPYTGNSSGSIVRLTFSNVLANAQVDTNCGPSYSPYEAVLLVDSATEFSVGDEITIARGTAREESARIVKIGTGTIYLSHDMEYNHTAAQADDVVGLDPQADKIVIFATTDGGSIYWLLDEIDYGTATYDDDVSDDELDYTSECPVDNFPPPAGELLLRVRNSIVIAGVPSDPRTAFYSAGVGQALEGVGEESFPALNFQSVPSGSERIMCMEELDDLPFVLTPDQIFTISGEDPEAFQLLQTRGGKNIGCISRKGVVATEAGLFFLSTDKKVYVLPTVDHIPQIISVAIEDALEEIASDVELEKIIMEEARLFHLNFGNQHYLVLAVPTGSSNVNNKVWLYDLDLHAVHPGYGWMGPQELAGGDPFQSLALFTSSRFSKTFLVADDSGYVREFLTGEHLQDDGVDFGGFYAFPWTDFKMPDVVKDFLTVEVVIPAKDETTGVVDSDSASGQTALNFYHTTVHADSASGQTTLHAKTEGHFFVGEEIIINRGGAREETAIIVDIFEEIYMVLDGNLTYTHTAAQGDTVEPNFTANSEIVIDRDGLRQEYQTIASVATGQLTLSANLENTHTAAQADRIYQMVPQTVPSDFLKLSLDSEDNLDTIDLYRVNEMERGNSMHRYRGFIMKTATRVKFRVNMPEEAAKAELWQLIIDYEPLHETSGMIHPA